MSSITTSFANIKSVSEIGWDTDPDLLAKWVQSEFVKGRAAHQKFLDKGRRPRFASKSEAFGLGWAFDEAWVADPTDAWLDSATAAAYTTQLLSTMATAKAEAQAAADALIEDSAANSMAPLMEHYESEALQEAMGVIEGYGSFTPEGFRPVVYLDFLKEAAVIKRAKDSTMEVAFHYNQLVTSLNDKVSRKETVGRGRVSLQFEINSDPDRFGHALVWEPGCPELVFLAMGEGTRAFQRGEKVWAVYYTPDLRFVEDRRTGELIAQGGWYNKKGWLGVVRTFGSFDAAADAMVELNQAIRTVRDADSDRIKAERSFEQRPEDADTDEQVEARIVRNARTPYSDL